MSVVHELLDLCEVKAGVRGSLYTIEDVDAFGKQISDTLDAPYVGVSKSLLGGDENVGLSVTISLQKKEDWKGTYLENSPYARFSVDNNGAVAQFSGGAKKWVKKPFRGFLAKSKEEVIKKLQAWVDANRLD